MMPSRLKTTRMMLPTMTGNWLPASAALPVPSPVSSKSWSGSSPWAKTGVATANDIAERSESSPMRTFRIIFLRVNDLFKAIFHGGRYAGSGRFLRSCQARDDEAGDGVGGGDDDESGEDRKS